MAEELLNFWVVNPKPPVILIDEATLKRTYDAGPVCQCRERYEAVKNLKLFMPGGTHAYEKKVFPDGECLQVLWVRKSVESRSVDFVKPVVFLDNDLSEIHYTLKQNPDELLFIKPPG